MDQRWARLFDVGSGYQVAVYIVSDGVNLGLMTTSMVDDIMIGESEVFHGEDIDQIRRRLDAVTQLDVELWMQPVLTKALGTH